MKWIVDEIVSSQKSKLLKVYSYEMASRQICQVPEAQQ